MFSIIVHHSLHTCFQRLLGFLCWQLNYTVHKQITKGKKHIKTEAHEHRGVLVRDFAGVRSVCVYESGVESHGLDQNELGREVVEDTV